MPRPEKLKLTIIRVKQHLKIRAKGNKKQRPNIPREARCVGKQHDFEKP